MQTQSTPTPEIKPEPQQIKGWQIGVAFGIFIMIYALGYAFEGEIRQFMVAGLNSLPFMALALLAYLGRYYIVAKVATFVWLAALVGATLLAGMGMTFMAGAGGVRVFALFVGGVLSIIVGALIFLPAVRRTFSHVLPLNPDSFVQSVALAAVVAIGLISFSTLLATGEPPLLAIVEQFNASGQDMFAGRGDAGMLRDLLYGLIWTIPAAIIAVGYGVQRSLPEALERLGLVRPTLRQVLAGLGLAVLLVAAVQLLSLGITWLWGAMGWPRTNEEAFGELLGFAMSPIGALVVGVTAGLGEELAVRGVLQPRLGILLSNLFFTGLHAFQYHWDALLIVFLVGTVCGLVRWRTNTTTAAIVHGTYNFLLVMLAVLQIPGLSQ